MLNSEIYIILLLALGLAVDAGTVAMGVAMHLGRANFRQKFRLVFHFGLFQFLMPLIGWGIGSVGRHLISEAAPTVAFVVLGALGAKMIYSSLKKSDIEKIEGDPTRGLSLILLSVATSLDALAAGAVLGLMQTNIFRSCLLIGLVTAVLTSIGIFLGHRASMIWQKYATIGGGCLLILVGLKIMLGFS